MKKLSTFLCMVLCSIALHANVVSGTCGDNLTWSYDTDTKALTIEGTGDMSYDAVPWAQVNSDILSVSLPDGLTSIGERAFSGCSSLTSITIPDGVTSIGGYAFSGCSITSITIPNSVTSIGYEAFAWCSSLTSITIPNSVTSIGSWAFEYCSSLTSITIPNSVTSIREYTFYYCDNLTSVTLGNSVTSIEGRAFYNCYNLTSITIPNSVTSIGGNAFSSCSQVIVECTTPPTIESSTFRSDAIISVPCFTVGVYLATPVWQFLPIVDNDTYRVNLSATESGKATITATDCDANTATIEATGDDCSHFVQWSDGITDNPRILNLTQDTTLVAQFESTTYQVNIYAGDNGLLRVGPDWDYWETDTFSIEMTDCGEELTTYQLCATPNEGYYFAGWSDGNTDQCRTFTITQDTTVVALFKEIIYYSVTLQGNSIRGYYKYINDWGGTSNSWFEYESEINITVREGMSVYFYENNMDCGTWLGWSDGVTDYERTITITSDTVITSLFDMPTYQVNLSAAANGSLTYYGEPIDDIEETLTDCNSNGEWIDAICAIPDEGYYFAGWSDGNTEQCRDFFITQDTTVVALFKEIKYYSVTLRGNSISGYYQYVDDWGGTSESGFYDSEINISVCEGLSVYFYENNMDCGTWLGWSDGVTDYERTITITSDTVITSLFDVPTYQVNISAAANGSLMQYGEPIGNIETTMTDCDSDGEWIYGLCAVPDEGYYFTGWSDGYTEQCRSIKVVSDTTLVANFAEKHQVQVLVGVESACKNMGTVSGSGIFYQGDVVTITATPNSGYHFVEWSDNGSSNVTREILLTTDTTLFATFAAGDMGGKCGNDLYWIWEEGALTITGTGKMDLKHHPAWRQYDEIQITSVSMPEGMTSISSNAFEGHPIATITVPASVDTVGNRAFADNDQLTHFEYLGNNIQWKHRDNEYYRPLYGCHNLQYFRGNIVLGVYYAADTIIVSNGYAFDDMYSAPYVDNTNATDEELWSYSTNAEVKTIQTLYLPAGLVEIGDFALQNARFLGGITIPEGVTRIGISAFEDCRSMDSVVFAGNNVQEIGAWAFYNCHSLRNLTLPEGVEEIGRAAFFDCVYLTELTIPSTMKKIADNGFAACRKLSTMYVNALVPPTIEAKTFEDVDRATPVFVPRGTMELYQADQYWSEFFNMAEYDAPTGNLTPAANETNALRKVFRNGQVLILRGDKTYTVLGETIQ